MGLWISIPSHERAATKLSFHGFFHPRRIHPQISCKFAVALKGEKHGCRGRFRPFYKLIGITGALPRDKTILKIREFHVRELETVYSRALDRGVQNQGNQVRISVRVIFNW